MNALLDWVLTKLRPLGKPAVTAFHWLFSNEDIIVHDDVLEFQNAIDIIIEQPPPRFMGSTILIILSMGLVLLVVSALLKVDVVVSAGGRLTTSTPPILLQPLERGIIRQLNVAVGDVVTKGQVLATLDPTFSEADLGSLTQQKGAMDAQLRRVEAELKGVPLDIGKTPTANDRIQLDIFQQRQTQYNSRLRVFDEQIQQIEANLRTIDNDRKMLSKQLDITKDVESMRAELLHSQTGSKLQYLDAQSTRIRLDREFQDASNRLIELQHDLQSRRAERQSYIDDWRRQITESVASTRTEAHKLDEGVTKAARMHDLVVITAPEDGVVLDVAKRSVGSVMRDAEPLFTIVPANAVLVADISIPSRDVGYVQAGNDVVIKIDAFPYQRHGLLDGKLLWISEDSSGSVATGMDTGAKAMAEAPGAFHRGRVEMPAEVKLHNMPKGARLFPGMTMSAEIKVNQRSVLSFFIAPIIKTLDESIREP